MLDDGPGMVPDLMPQDDGLRIVLPSEVVAVRRALRQLEARLAPLDLNVEETGTLQIVLAEALNNIVEHAYEGTAGVVEIEVSRGESGLVFVITDRGREMPEGDVPLGKIPDYPKDPEEMPEGGFGWFLIHDLTRELSYRRVDDRNLLTFRLALGAAAGQG